MVIALALEKELTREIKIAVILITAVFTLPMVVMTYVIPRTLPFHGGVEEAAGRSIQFPDRAHLN